MGLKQDIELLESEGLKTYPLKSGSIAYAHHHILCDTQETAKLIRKYHKQAKKDVEDICSLQEKLKAAIKSADKDKEGK